MNRKAGRLIPGISTAITENVFDLLRDEEHKFGGYASYYLQECWNESELINKADVAVYKQLLEIDSKLGTTQSEQLLHCVFYTLRMDLIKV